MSVQLQKSETPRGGSGEMFDRIAPRYDLLNRLMSVGLDHRWRKRTVKALELPPNAHVLDLATGTADVALAIARRYPTATIIGSDPSAGMLEVGDEKIARAQLTKRVRLEVGDAQELPYDDASFHGVTMAFGIRNVPDRARALAEMARVTKPGGRICILELAEPRRGLLAPLARFHVRVLVPRMGALLSGSREYRYLQESIAAFPPPDAFAALLGAAGLEVTRVQKFGFGACYLYVATPRRSAA